MSVIVDNARGGRSRHRRWSSIALTVLATISLLALPAVPGGADPAPVEPSATGFSDVAGDHPFHGAISWMAATGITNGYPDGTFRPGAPVTRQSAAVFLAKLYELTGGAATPGTTTFSDVPSDHPFHSAISWMAATGITNGYPDGTFRPGAPVTRQSAAAFLAKADGLIGQTGVRDALPVGQELRPGQRLTSPSGAYQLVMQLDGNLVVYTDGGAAIWNSGSAGHPGALARMQADGNLVVYKPTGEAVWYSNTSGNNLGGGSLRMQDDSNLVAYSVDGRAVWTSHGGPTGVQTMSLHTGQQLNAGQRLISPNGEYEARMQGDGNFAIYSPGDIHVWSTGSQGHTNPVIIMQSDGNFVIYAQGGVATWASHTSGGGLYVTLQDDGNLVVYTGDRSARWSWKTGLVNAGNQVTIMGPLASGALSSSPLQPHHRPYNGNWAADIGAGAGSTVWANFDGYVGTLQLTVADIFEPCETAGTGGLGVTVQVALNGNVLGRVHYAHLINLTVSENQTIANGKDLGQLIGSGEFPCWDGAHVHIEAVNQHGFSCFVPKSLGNPVSTSDPIGVLGGTYASGPNGACPPGAA